MSSSALLPFVAMKCRQYYLPLQYVCLGFSLYNTQQWKKRDRELGDVDLPYCEGLEVSVQATAFDTITARMRQGFSIATDSISDTDAAHAGGAFEHSWP